MKFFKEDIESASHILECSYEDLVEALQAKNAGGISIVRKYPSLPRHPDGKLCRFSPLGKEQRLRRDVDAPGRMEPWGDNSVRVRWARGEGGWTGPTVYHKDLIELVPD